MDKPIENTLPKLVLAWVGSLIFSPFLIISAVFINVYQLNVDLITKYFLSLSGALVLYYVDPGLCMIYLMAVLLIGIFTSCYSQGLGLFNSGPISVLVVNSVFFALGVYFFQAGELNWNLIQNFLYLQSEKFVEAGVLPANFSKKDLVIGLWAYQVPSVLIIFSMLILFFSVIFEKSTLKLMSFRASSKERLSYFKLPDFMIWVLILSLAFGYIDFGNSTLKIIALNLLNISVLCYFFQGFAVLFNFFEVFRVGFFTKLVMVMCFVIQLSVVTVAMGVLDYWFDFRGKFIKKATQVNKERSGL